MSVEKLKLMNTFGVNNRQRANNANLNSFNQFFSCIRHFNLCRFKLVYVILLQEKKLIT